MRNKVLETISESFKIDEKLYLLLGDLGVFQSRKAFEIDDYRCINYGIMEQSMIGFAAGISIANCYPIAYSITPFIVERCYEQLKLDFGYNENKLLIISAGGSFDYNKLGPTHYCPNDISLLIKANCKNIFLPWNEKDAEKFILSIIKKKAYSYLRLSSEEINEKIKPRDISEFLEVNKVEDIIIGLGPDSFVLSNYLKLKLDYSVSVINDNLIELIKKIISKKINITIVAGFNLDFLLNLLSSNSNNNNLIKSGYLNLIYSMDSKFDTSEEKITHLTSNIKNNKFFLK